MDLACIKKLKHELESSFEEGVAPIFLLETCARRFPENPFLNSLRNLPVGQIGLMMATQNVAVLGQALRGRALAAGAKAIAARDAIAIGAHGEGRPAPSMAVGYALNKQGDYELEVRLQNPDITSLLFARELVVDRSNVPTRVGVLRNLIAHAAHPAALNNNPLTLGSSVGLGKGLAGSLGGFVRQEDGAVGILSCSHILARCGQAAPNDPVYHPSPKDDALGYSEIGRLRRSVNLADDKPDYPADVAFAVLDTKHNTGANIIPRGHDWPNEGVCLRDIRRGDLVKGTAAAMIGRTSGWATGRVVQENQGPVDIYMPDLRRSVKIYGLTEIEWSSLDDPFSQKGDSGSMVYLAETLEPIGLLVGGGLVDITENGKKRTFGASYACPVGTILREWGLTFIQ